MSDLAMSIHEKLKGLLINKDLNDAMGALIEEALQSEWAIGFHDRGMGRGDFAVIEKDTEVVIVKCPYREIAEHITSIHNTAPETARQRDELLAICKNLCEIMWLTLGSPLDLAAQYGPDFERPSEKDIKTTYLKAVAAIDNAEAIP